MTNGIGEDAYWYGKERSQKTKKQISKTLKGFKQPARSEEHCRKISERMKKWHAKRRKEDPNYWSGENNPVNKSRNTK